MEWGKQFRIIFVVALAASIFAIAYFSPNTGANSDPRYTLLVSQALIEHQTIRLDAYRTAIANQAPVEWRLWENDGHTYYCCPLAASLLSIPLVLLLHRLGYDMTTLPDEALAQNYVSAAVVALIFLLLYRIARYYLPFSASLVIAAVSVLGTTLMSTLGTALWSQNFALLFICLSLWVLVRLENDDPFFLMPYVLGAFLFLAYFSRPATAVFIAATLAFLFLQYCRYFWRTAFAALVLLLGFVLFSQREYGLWLPAYYLPRQLGGLLSYGKEETTPLPVALYGLLFSPSRGLFVYSAIFLVAIGGFIRYWQSVKRHTLLWLIAIWSIGHLLFVARFPNWWGGFSFGPRLLTEIIPALALLTIFVAQAWLKDPSSRSRQLAAVLFLTTGFTSIAIHSYVGMFSHDMLLSHGQSLPPHVDKAPYLLLDWRYPQFLTTPASACARNRAYFRTMIAEGIVSFNDYSLGREILAQEAGNAQEIPGWAWWQETGEEVVEEPTAASPPNSQAFLPLVFTGHDMNAIFIGWALPGPDGTWSTCHTADVVLGPVKSAAPDEELTLTISARGHQVQPVAVRINGERVGQFTFSGVPTELSVAFPGSLLNTGRLNYLSLDIPHAFVPRGADDSRLLGIFFEKLVIDR